MYLGPVVVVQQALDHSPQTPHPRKVKEGGSTSAAAKSSGV